MDPVLMYAIQSLELHTSIAMGQKSSLFIYIFYLPCSGSLRIYTNIGVGLCLNKYVRIHYVGVLF